MHLDLKREDNHIKVYYRIKPVINQRKLQANDALVDPPKIECIHKSLPASSETQFHKNTIRIHCPSTPWSGLLKDDQSKRGNSRTYKPQNGDIPIEMTSHEKGGIRPQCQIRDFSYTEVFDSAVSEESIYMKVAQPIVRGCLNSRSKLDGTIIAWGIRESGKTYTILGSKNYQTRSKLKNPSGVYVDYCKKFISDSKAARSNLDLSYQENYVNHEKNSDVSKDNFRGSGILERAVYDLFDYTEHVKIWLSVFQCTEDECIQDKLVSGFENHLRLKRKSVDGVLIEDLIERRVNSVNEAFLVVEEAHRNHINHSHASGHFFYRLLIEKSFGPCKYETDSESINLDSHRTSPLEKRNKFRADDRCALNRNLIAISAGKMATSYKCTLLIVDSLASDHLKKYQTSSKNKELPSIGMTLTPFAAVVAALTRKGDDTKRFVPYRDSKFTLLMKNSLGGSARTAFIMLLDPLADYDTILQTLSYGIHIQKIKNKIADVKSKVSKPIKCIQIK